MVKRMVANGLTDSMIGMAKVGVAVGGVAVGVKLAKALFDEPKPKKKNKKKRGK